MTSRSNREVVISDWTTHISHPTEPTYLRWWSASEARTAVTERTSVEVLVNRMFTSASSMGWGVTIYVKNHSWGDGINYQGSRKDAERTFKTLEGAMKWGTKIGAEIAQKESII